eukprot:GABV01001412.1.p2 GENE.GABV01001412.1~~GABV01001412.1.p2  ORF type:complete len:164 (+),score=54.13 GABV01001412.1:352-843(+)
MRWGFLQNRKRFNVALTRAQALQIVVGNPFVLCRDENWRALIEWAASRGAVYGDHNLLEETLNDPTRTFKNVFASADFVMPPPIEENDETRQEFNTNNPWSAGPSRPTTTATTETAWAATPAAAAAAATEEEQRRPRVPVVVGGKPMTPGVMSWTDSEDDEKR